MTDKLKPTCTVHYDDELNLDIEWHGVTGMDDLPKAGTKLYEIPPGYTLAPISTTSAQKFHVNGEFSVEFDQDCRECVDTDSEEYCEVCHGAEMYQEKIIIPWTTCKDIYYAMLKAAKESS